MFIFGVVKSTKQKSDLNQKKIEIVVMVDFVYSWKTSSTSQVVLIGLWKKEYVNPHGIPIKYLCEDWPPQSVNKAHVTHNIFAHNFEIKL